MSLEGSGRISSAQLMLNANRGRFLTRTAGAARRIDRMALVDISVGRPPWGRAAHTYRFVVTRLEPQRTPDGTQLTVELMGAEWLLRNVLASGHWVFRQWREIINLVRAQVPASVGAPAVSALPPAYAYAWGSLDVRDGLPVYDAIMRALSALNVPVAAGGVGDILTLTPDWNGTPLMRIRRLGSRNAAVADADKPLIDATAGYFMECQQTHEPEEGTHVVVRGQQDFGSLPVDWATWRSALETHANYPDFDASVAYVEGARVRHGGEAWVRTGHATQDAPPARHVAQHDVPHGPGGHAGDGL